MTNITVETYTGMQAAYDHFNASIFDGKLPQCLITLSFHRGAYGYFRHEPFTPRAIDVTKAVRSKKVVKTDEIALNPFTFAGRTDREILSTLVHEMVHLWQHHLPEPKKTKSHHDKAWAAKMEEIGLMPSSTGMPGGKRTGRRVSHYIVKGGVYEKAWAKCKVKLQWDGLMHEPAHKGSKRTKYTCPKCDENAYGKAGLNLECGDCNCKMRVSLA